VEYQFSTRKKKTDIYLPHLTPKIEIDLISDKINKSGIINTKIGKQLLISNIIMTILIELLFL
jgi:hypothetical protein